MARRRYEHTELELIERLFALLFAHSLIPCRQYYRYDRNSESFVIYIKHGIDAAFTQPVLNGNEFVLVAERLPSDKYCVRMLELEIRAL